MTPFFSVDQGKCIRCGVCAEICPIRIIVAKPGRAVPELVDWGAKTCIRCGHCVAVCPKGALSLECMPVEKCRELGRDWRVQPDKIELFLKGRRSVRCYTDDPVDRATLEKLIDIGRCAPSGINLQPVRWVVIRESSKVKELAGLTVEWMRSLIAQGASMAEAFSFPRIVAAWEGAQDPVARGAPHIILAYALKEDPTAPAACTIALSYLEIAAASYGLGACWAGYVQMAVNSSDDVRKAVGISKRAACHGAMLVGHPRFQYARIPLRNEAHILWK